MNKLLLLLCVVMLPLQAMEPPRILKRKNDESSVAVKKAKFIPSNQLASIIDVPALEASSKEKELEIILSNGKTEVSITLKAANLSPTIKDDLAAAREKALNSQTYTLPYPYIDSETLQLFANLLKVDTSKHGFTSNIDNLLTIQSSCAIARLIITIDFFDVPNLINPVIDFYFKNYLLDQDSLNEQLIQLKCPCDLSKNIEKKFEIFCASNITKKDSALMKEAATLFPHVFAHQKSNQRKEANPTAAVEKAHPVKVPRIPNVYALWDSTKKYTRTKQLAETDLIAIEETHPNEVSPIPQVYGVWAAQSDVEKVDQQLSNSTSQTTETKEQITQRTKFRLEACTIC